MKSKRRHELQTNALARILGDLPAAWQQYGGRVLLLVVAAVLVFVLVRYQISSSRQARQAAHDSLGTAREQIEQLKNLGPWAGSSQQVATIRRQLAGDTANAIDLVATESDDAKVLAEALIARGDLNWTLGTMPDLPGSATQPSLLPDKKPEEYLNIAADAYQAVLDQYPQEKPSAVAAHFGLAAIAENRRQWDVAKQHYQAILDNKDIASSYQTQAKIRLESLPRLEAPVMLAEPATQMSPATGPTLSSAEPNFVTTRPTTDVEAPASAPAAPASAPVITAAPSTTTAPSATTAPAAP